MSIKFSVLMSLYYKEKASNLRECFDSLLNQTIKADEWVVVEDGVLTDELYKVLDEYQSKYPSLIKRYPFKENRGLGLALRDGLIVCSNELVARMDTDDIARSDRFEKQLQMFKDDETLDICGSHIKEFDGNIENILAIRKVPITHEEIIKYQKKRDAFNHMTVMYKKSAVLKAGNYEHCPLMEDTYLWARMIVSGAKCKNVDDYLVFARTGHDMFERRGGWKYFKKYKNGLKKVRKTKFISRTSYFISISIQFVVALVPNKLRSWIFIKLLRKPNE